MTAEMTRAGMEAEARRRFAEIERKRESRREAFLMAVYTAAIIGGVALLLAWAHVKRAERDSRAEMMRAHYELMAVTGGAR